MALFQQAMTPEITSALRAQLLGSVGDTNIMNEKFRPILTTDRSRLENTGQRASSAMRQAPLKAISNIQQLMNRAPPFGKPAAPPLELIGFLTQFKATCDTTVVKKVWR